MMKNVMVTGTGRSYALGFHPLSSYDAAEILRKLFEERRYDKTGHRFITNEGKDYPF